MRVETMVVDTMVVVDTHAYMGETEENMSLPLAFMRGGTVTEVCVRTGQRVRKGDVLMRVSEAEARKAYEMAAATLTRAKDGLDRARAIHEKELIADVKWVEIETQYRQAEAAAALAQEELERCVMVAPHSGIVSECRMHVGQQLLPGQTALTLTSEGMVQVRIAVPEADVPDMQIGDRARIELPALGVTNVQGIVSEKSLTVNRLSHTYDAVLTMEDGKAVAQVVPGMVAKVYMQRGQERGFIVPAHCVSLTQHGKTIWAVTEGVAHRREVKTGRYTEAGVLICEGLAAGDEIVVAGYQKLAEGLKVMK